MSVTIMKIDQRVTRGQNSRVPRQEGCLLSDEEVYHFDAFGRGDQTVSMAEL